MEEKSSNILFISKMSSFLDNEINGIKKGLVDTNHLKEKIERLIQLRIEIEEREDLTLPQKKALFFKIDTLLLNYYSLKQEKDDWIILIKQDIKLGKVLVQSFKRNPTILSSFYQSLREQLPEEKIYLVDQLQTKNDNSSLLRALNIQLEREIVSVNNLNYFMENIQEKEKISFQTMKIIKSIIEKLENDSDIRMRVDDIANYTKVKRLLLQKLDELVNHLKEEDMIRRKIETNEISLQPLILERGSYQTNYEKYQKVEDQHIISIDDITSPDLDTAFHIKKEGDLYLLDVYISDAVHILNENRRLAEEAYQRGATYYVRGNGKTYNIDMLPRTLAHFDLSLNKGFVKNVNNFNFIIDQEGNILSRTVNNKRIIVRESLSPFQAKRILEDDCLESKEKEQLLVLKECCMKVKKQSHLPYINGLNPNKIQDLVALTSILVNYYVGENSSFAIYRENGHYTTEKYAYTHSSTPLRRIVSDINLAFFLNQYGLLELADKDIYKIEDHKEEIVNHLNETDKIQKYINSHSKELKKILKI